jgi:hypothetical protein
MLWRNLQGSGWRNHDRQVSHPVAEFIIPDWEDKVNSGIGLSAGMPGYIGWRAGTTILCRSQLYLPVRDYEFGYSSQY